MIVYLICNSYRESDVLCVRIESRPQQQNQKLHPRNNPGVFLGFATLKNTYGTVIETQKSLVVARDNCAYDEEIMPYHHNSNTPMTVCIISNGY